MNKEKSIELLEGLLTSIHYNKFNEETLDAIKFAIDNLKKKESYIVEIDQDEINTIFIFLKNISINPTYSRITKFLLGSNKLVEAEITSHVLFGKYKNKYKRGELTDYVVSILKQNKVEIRKSNIKKVAPWSNINFFQEKKYNRLSENAIDQLIGKIEKIELVHKESLTKSIIEYRKINPRYREPWSQEEIRLLEIALKYTNDLEILSKYFGRTCNSIEFQGQQIIYYKQINSE